MMLYEMYSDRSAFDVQLASVHFIDFDATVRDWIIDRQVVFLRRI